MHMELLIFDNYNECSPKNHEITHRVGVGCHWLQHETKMLLLCWEVIMKNKTKWELSALVSSRSLDERTDVESQINGLYLTTWCRHHNTVLDSKDASEEYNVIRMLCGNTDFCLPSPVLGQQKLAPGLTFRWWIGRCTLYIKFACKNLIAKCLQLLGISLALIWYHTCRAKGIVSHEYFSEGCLSRTPTVYLAILVQLMLISWKLHNLLSVCQLASTADDWHQLYMCKRGKPIRMMALYQQVRICLCISCKPLCCNPQSAGPPPLDLCSSGLAMKGGLLVLAISHAPAGPNALIVAITCGCVAQGKACSTQYNFYHHHITCMMVCNCA